ncbi:uncharacterized protein LOC100841448 [Brachypodium distachyon]|uniref:uncharacterized protein LOC100841448 n=1 Tax=Brachypodium distachyon TaxID=15368 RepID=UPI000D0D4774|nr:uncharacterized protein LOC100841448 [Brachypodium distachyon]|eukprot:XP_024316565.1 uncharacterized protein LOC100841448 [Brachypodium distachyon]
MEAALVSAATGALKPVLEKLAALLGEKYKHFKRVCGDIKSLTHELATMDDFLLKMSEEEDPDPQDKAWMNEVRELSYDMEDSIDDFMKQVDDKDTKPDGFMEKIKSSLGKMKARRRIGKEVKDLKKQIVEVAERNARYKTREAFSKTTNATVDPRALAIFVHASKLVGIDEPKKEIIKMLTEVKIFGWLFCRDRLNTRCNLFKKTIVSSDICPRCNLLAESRDHLFYLCPSSQAIWRRLGISHPVSGTTPWSAAMPSGGQEPKLWPALLLVVL